MDFALAVNLSSPSVISLKIEIAFAADGNKISLTIVEVLLHAAAGDLTRSKKQRDWTLCNTVLLPPFLTEVVILHGKLDAGKLLKIFARFITEWTKDKDTTSEADDANSNDRVFTIDAWKAKAKPVKAKQASTKTFTTITDDCNDILAFLQAVSIKFT